MSRPPPALKRTENEKALRKRRRARRFGAWAEMAAVLWLRMKFYRILARNYRISGGEIDIIAQRGAVIAFVEVKGRPDAAAALSAIDRRKQERISRAARHWLARNPWAASRILRGDAILVDRRRFRLQHIPNAFAAHAD